LLSNKSLRPIYEQINLQVLENETTHIGNFLMHAPHFFLSADTNRNGSMTISFANLAVSAPRDEV
jgi:hypothetical protein